MGTERGGRAGSTRTGVLGLVAACLFTVAACGPHTASSVPSGGGTPHGCPFKGGEDCLGPLKPGTYHSSAFTPPITYTVPKGWSNIGDQPGNFGLGPSGASIARMNADTSDSIGVATSVVMQPSCSFRHPPSLAVNPRAYTRWLRQQPALIVRDVHIIMLGGLKGTVQTVWLSPRWQHTCPWAKAPQFPYLAGSRPTTLEWVVSDKDVIRLYLLSTTYFGERVVLAIAAVSVHHGRGLSRLTRVVRTFRFGHPL